MKKQKRTRTLAAGILCGLAALCVTVYPLIGNYLSEKNRSTVLTEYAGEAEAEQHTEAIEAPVTSTWERQYIQGLAIGSLIAALAGIFARMTIFRRRGKHEARKRR